MSEPAPALAFFDPEHGLHGTARAGVTLLFEGRSPPAALEGPDVAAEGDGYRAALDGQFELEFAPVAGEAQLAGARHTVCRVTGKVKDTAVSCLGVVTETVTAPAWSELDALRAVSAVFDPEHAVLAVARRPRGALGHGVELVSASLLAGEEPLSVEEARISTVYDAEGRQRSAGLELWMPGEDFPRRLWGTVVAGTTLELSGLRVNASIFTWRMEGRVGAGAYDVTIREEPLAAA